MKLTHLASTEPQLFKLALGASFCFLQLIAILEKWLWHLWHFVADCMIFMWSLLYTCARLCPKHGLFCSISHISREFSRSHMIFWVNMRAFYTMSFLASTTHQSMFLVRTWHPQKKSMFLKFEVFLWMPHVPLLVCLEGFCNSGNLGFGCSVDDRIVEPLVSFWHGRLSLSYSSSVSSYRIPTLTVLCQYARYDLSVRLLEDVEHAHEELYFVGLGAWPTQASVNTCSCMLMTRRRLMLQHVFFLTGYWLRNV